MAATSGNNQTRAAVQSVHRAVSVLEFLSRVGWAGVTEVANALDVHKSTAYRLLATLKDRGLVEQDVDTDRYRLGMGMVALASTVAADLDLVRAARPVCQRLSEQTQETVTLTVLAGDEAVVIYQASAPSSAVSVNWTGRHVPLHCGSDGKILLAHLPESRQRSILRRPLSRFTENTIVDPARLRVQLRAIRANGSASAVQEFEIGLNSVGAPIRSADGSVIAALSVSGPAFRLPLSSLPRLQELAVGAAADISRRLGFQTKAAEAR